MRLPARGLRRKPTCFFRHVITNASPTAMAVDGIAVGIQASRFDPESKTVFLVAGLGGCGEIPAKSFQRGSSFPACLQGTILVLALLSSVFLNLEVRYHEGPRPRNRPLVSQAGREPPSEYHSPGARLTEYAALGPEDRRPPTRRVGYLDTGRAPAITRAKAAGSPAPFSILAS